MTFAGQWWADTGGRGALYIIVTTDLRYTATCQRSLRVLDSIQCNNIDSWGRLKSQGSLSKFLIPAACCFHFLACRFSVFVSFHSSLITCDLMALIRKKDLLFNNIQEVLIMKNQDHAKCWDFNTILVPTLEHELKVSLIPQHGR